MALAAYWMFAPGVTYAQGASASPPQKPPKSKVLYWWDGAPPPKIIVKDSRAREYTRISPGSPVAWVMQGPGSVKLYLVLDRRFSETGDDKVVITVRQSGKEKRFRIPRRPSTATYDGDPDVLPPRIRPSMPVAFKVTLANPVGRVVLELPEGMGGAVRLSGAKLGEGLPPVVLTEAATEAEPEPDSKTQADAGDADKSTDDDAGDSDEDAPASKPSRWMRLALMGGGEFPSGETDIGWGAGIALDIGIPLPFGGRAFSNQMDVSLRAWYAPQSSKREIIVPGRGRDASATQFSHTVSAALGLRYRIPGLSALGLEPYVGAAGGVAWAGTELQGLGGSADATNLTGVFTPFVGLDFDITSMIGLGLEVAWQLVLLGDVESGASALPAEDDLSALHAALGLTFKL